MPQRSHSTTPNDHLWAKAIAITLVILGASQLIITLDLRWLLIFGLFSATLIIITTQRRRQIQAAQERQRLLKSEATSLTPQDFELRVLNLLQQLGWKNLEHVGGSGDGGVDIRGIYNNHRYIVQCKRYKQIIGPGFVRELEGTLKQTGADRALLVTTSYFSSNTHRSTQGTRIELWDGKHLSKLEYDIQQAQQDPNLIAQKRRKKQQFYGTLVAINALITLTIFLVLPQMTIRDYVNVQNMLSQATIPTPTTTHPTQSASITQGIITAQKATPAPQAKPITATVFNGGNVRTQPNLTATVIDQIHAHESVELLKKTRDGQWYQINNPRGIIGWVHASLLSIDQKQDQLVQTTP